MAKKEVQSLRQRLRGLDRMTKSALKVSEIVKTDQRGTFTFSGGTYEIIDTIASGHVLEVFVRAHDHEGLRYGFSKNGTVEIERIRIVNPPVLIDDPAGDIVIEQFDELTGLTRSRHLREDPTAALREVIADTLRLIVKPGKNVVDGKIGRTTTVVYASAGDGSVLYAGNSSWATTHDTATGTSNTSGNTQSYCAAVQYFAPVPQFRIDRGFLPFDTSAIGATDTIDAAVVSVYQNSAVPLDVNDSNSFIAVVQTRQAATSSLANGDYDECGESTANGWSNAFQSDIIEGATRRNLSALSTGYNDFTLNATGRGWIARSGETKPTGAASAGFTFLGLREGHDLLDATYPSASTKLDGLNDITYSEETGTTKDPKLTIDHTSPITVNNSRAAEIRGQATTNNSRAAEIRGQDSTSSSRAAEITGFYLSSRAAEIRGQATANSARAAEVTGSLGADSARAAEVRGQATANAARAAEVRGQDTANSARAAEISGEVAVDSTRAAQITGADQAKKTIFIKAYTSAGDFLGVIADASFRSFTKRIDEGLGECLFTVARKFDQAGTELLEGNLVEVFVSDKETVAYDGTDNTGVRRVYQGRVSGLRLAAGATETMEVRCMGHWVSLGLDVLKNAAQTTLYTRSTGGVGTTTTAQSVDIGTVVRGILDRYIAETTNPLVRYTSASVPTVGSSMNYIFRQRTYREAVQKCLDAAPYGHFSYVDENGLFSFKSISTTPDHKFYFQKHFADIEIQRGLSRVRNFLLLWAPAATAYRDYSDGESILRYGRQVERVTDNNIQDTGTMDLVGARFIEQNKGVEVRIIATILDSNGDEGKGYDIEDISPGDTCAFYNLDSSIGSVMKENMIITEVEYEPGQARITVEPVRLTSVADITSRLKQQVSEEKTKDGTTPIPDSHA